DGPTHQPDYRGVPSVAFTLPPIAAVGLSEEAARRGVVALRVNAASTPDWVTARRLAEPVYGHKLLIDEDTDLILGAHLVGPN
ncbi:NAD(P)/FAD-dependent oxidoreductase, partial [Acinetobacter baumannii]